MSKPTFLIRTTMFILLLPFLPSLIRGEEDFSFLIKVCYRYGKAQCLGTYIRENYILSTDPCAWHINARLHHRAFLLGGGAGEANCELGEERNAVKPYTDGQTYKGEAIRKISLIKIEKPYALSKEINIINATLENITLEDRNIHKCDTYAYKHGLYTLQKLTCKLIERNTCMHKFEFLAHHEHLHCIQILRNVTVLNSPVICGNAVEGFIIQVKGDLAAFVSTSTQGNWISIIADGKTLKVAMSSNSFRSRLSSLLCVFLVVYLFLKITKQNI